jgi:uncharacterized protein YndB with AHSA1/START domain
VRQDIDIATNAAPASAIVLRRVFDAPRRVVFDAITRPEMLHRWFAPEGWRLVICDADLRVDGAWRVVLRGPADARVTMRGFYREIARPARIVTIETSDEFPGEYLRTMILSSHGKRTTLTTTLVSLAAPWNAALALHSAMPPSTRWACPVM